MRVILDTNVLVSAFLSLAGPPARILQQWEQGAFDFIVSEALLAEYRRVLAYQHVASHHGLTPHEIDEAVEAIRDFALVVEPQEMLTVITADLADNRVLECAIAGDADYIVSGDTRHLLPLQEYRGIIILSPTAFLAVLAE